MPVEALITPHVAVLFPGQGVQSVGMGQALHDQHPEARDVFIEASDKLHLDMRSLCFEDSERLLASTEHAQPAIVTVSIAALRVMEKTEELHDYQVAGHSLGEFSALVAAEALTFGQAVILAKYRGRLMAEEGNRVFGKMVAVVGLPLQTVETICKQSGAEIANINSPDQIVIAGRHDAVRLATRLIIKENVWPIELNVSIASHCSLMEPVREKFSIFLKATKINNPKKPFVSSVKGKYVEDHVEVQRLLIEQPTQRVLWLDTIRTLGDNGVDTFIQVTPGNAIAKLAKQIVPSANVYSYDGAMKGIRLRRKASA